MVIIARHNTRKQQFQSLTFKVQSDFKAENSTEFPSGKIERHIGLVAYTTQNKHITTSAILPLFDSDNTRSHSSNDNKITDRPCNRNFVQCCKALRVQRADTRTDIPSQKDKTRIRKHSTARDRTVAGSHIKWRHVKHNEKKKR